MMGMCPAKFTDCKGTSITLDYLRPEISQIPEELLKPVPVWAQEPQLSDIVNSQSMADPDLIFGNALNSVEELWGILAPK